MTSPRPSLRRAHARLFWFELVPARPAAQPSISHPRHPRTQQHRLRVLGSPAPPHPHSRAGTKTPTPAFNHRDSSSKSCIRHTIWQHPISPRIPLPASVVPAPRARCSPLIYHIRKFPFLFGKEKKNRQSLTLRGFGSKNETATGDNLLILLPVVPGRLSAAAACPRPWPGLAPCPRGSVPGVCC